MIGRYQRFRVYQDGEALLPVYVMDRRLREIKLEPRRMAEKIWQDIGGKSAPNQARGVLDARNHAASVTIAAFSGFGTTSPATTLALSSAYTYASAGNCILTRLLPNGKTLNAVYFYISASTGTAANVTSVDVEVRNSLGLASAPAPGTSLLFSGVVNPNLAGAFVGWHKLSNSVTGETTTALTSAVLAQGSPTWVVVCDADGNGTDNATITTGTGTEIGSVYPYAVASSSYTSTNGGSTATHQSRSAGVILEFSDGSVVGANKIANANTSSTTNRKGVVWSDGFAESFDVYGGHVGGHATVTTGVVLEFYRGAALPGSPDKSISAVTETYGPHASSANLTYVNFDFAGAPLRVRRGEALRMVRHQGATSFSIPAFNYGTTNGYDTVLQKAHPGGAGAYLSISNGTTDWSNDDTAKSVQFGLCVDELVPLAVFNHPGMTGGFRG